MRLTVGLAALVLSAVACSNDESSEGAHSREVARELERAGLGCLDAHAGPARGQVENSTVCTLAGGASFTIDAFTDQGDLRQDEANSRRYACEFYPEAARGTDGPADLDGFPYLRGKWWQGMFTIEGIGPDPDAFDADAYEPLAAATGGEVVRIDC